MRKLGWTALCMAAAVALAGQANAAVMYTVALTPASISARHFNDLGQIADVGINDQGHLAGFDAPSSAGTTWSGINEIDQSVGTVQFSAPRRHAALWSGGALTDLGALPGVSDSGAAAINDFGLVVGGANPDGQFMEEFAVYWDSAGIHQLPHLTNAFDKFNIAAATDVNNSGLIVGFSENDTHSSEAVLWSGGLIQDLGHIGSVSAFSAAWAVNDAGQIVGESATDSGPDTGFLWEDGSMTDLNQLIAPDPDGWAILAALDINNQGQILAQEVYLPTFARRMVILNPITGGVPEPATWAMMLLGFVGLGAALRRSRSLGATL